jgi:hypothetical protein
MAILKLETEDGPPARSELVCVELGRRRTVGRGSRTLSA